MTSTTDSQTRDEYQCGTCHETMAKDSTWTDCGREDCPLTQARAMTTPELKPCPFCGGKADPRGWKAGDGRTGPECEACGATASSEVDWERRLLATTEMERLLQALADAHGLLVSYGKLARQSKDLAHDAERHFGAYRDKTA